MRKARHQTVTKVWHNPEIQVFSRRHESSASQRPHAAHGKPSADSGDGGKHRAALEALFSPRGTASKPGAAPGSEGPQSRGAPNGPKSERPQTRIVQTSQPAPSDPQLEERKRLLSKLLVAEGRPKISKAAADFLRAGFDFPIDQDVYLQLLEHNDDQYVRTAIDGLSGLLSEEEPKRRAILESRLRRIEEYAEEADTRTAASHLLKKLSSGRFGSAGGPRSTRDSETQ